MKAALKLQRILNGESSGKWGNLSTSETCLHFIRKLICFHKGFGTVLAYIKLSPTYEIDRGRVDRLPGESGVNTIFRDVIEIDVYAILSSEGVVRSVGI